MLRYLRITNLAIIDELEIEFGAGFNVVTGETGAGKSVIVGALGLLLGDRAEASLIRAGQETAEIEGEFELPVGHPAFAVLGAAGIPCEDGGLAVRRQIAVGKRQRCFVNDRLCTLATVAEALGQVVDLSSQHEHVALTRTPVQLELFDAYAGAGELRAHVAERYDAWKQAVGAVAAFRASSAAAQEKANYLRFVLEDIGRVAPEAGELERLEDRRRVLANAEKVMEGCAEAIRALSEGGTGVAEQASRAWRALDRIAKYMPPALAQAEVPRRLEEIRAAADDLARELERTLEEIPAGEHELDAIEGRIVDLRALARRYGGTLEAVLARQAEAAAELELAGNPDERLGLLEGEAAASGERYAEAAVRLSKVRERAAAAFGQRVREGLELLALPHAAFEARLTPCDNQRTGRETVEFYFCANPGQALSPLAKTASGGELSRLTLAIKWVLLDSDPVWVCVFDEIDTGIGGRQAGMVGAVLGELAATRQVIAITHLAQIASLAQHHYKVTKAVQEGMTKTAMQKLDGDSRIEEIARMMGGDTVSATGRRHARELLAHGRRARPMPS